MNTYCQIYNGKAWWIFQADQMPEFHPDIVIKDITNVTPLPQEGWDYNASTDTFTAPVIQQPTLVDAQASKITQINDAYNVKLSAGFTSSASGSALTYGYGASDQLKFMQLAILVLAGKATFPVTVHPKDGSSVQLTQAQYNQLVADIAVFAETLDTQQHQYITQVNTSTTIDQVNAITVKF